MTDHTTNEPTSEIPYGYCHCGCGQKTNTARQTDNRLGWVKDEPLKYILGHCQQSAPYDSVSEAFWARCAVGAPDECWEWKGRISEQGYGEFRHERVLYRANRVSWEIHNGPIPDGLYACHRCDNRKCCNPAHLWLGTHKDNQDDKVQKGRTPKGEDSGQSKLAEADVRIIRSLRAAGVSFRQIAMRYSVCDKTIAKIVRRETWKHIS